MMMIILFESFKIFQVSSGGRDGGDTALHCAALFGHPLVVQVVVVVYCCIVLYSSSLLSPSNGCSGSSSFYYSWFR